MAAAYCTVQEVCWYGVIAVGGQRGLTRSLPPQLSHLLIPGFADGTSHQLNSRLSKHWGKSTGEIVNHRTPLRAYGALGGARLLFCLAARRILCLDCLSRPELRRLTADQILVHIAGLEPAGVFFCRRPRIQPALRTCFCCRLSRPIPPRSNSLCYRNLIDISFSFSISFFVYLPSSSLTLPSSHLVFRIWRNTIRRVSG